MRACVCFDVLDVYFVVRYEMSWSRSDSHFALRRPKGLPPPLIKKKKKPPFSPLSVLQDHLQFQLPIEQLASVPRAEQLASVPRAEQHPIAMAQDLARRCGAADEAFFREAMASPAAAETERESRRRLSYGTAGFRREGSTLIGVAFRCGMLAAVRSIALQGRATGLVVTASHNPVEDNGVKLVDGDGGMLHLSWEKHAEAIVSAQNAVDLEQVVLRIVSVRSRWGRS